MAAKNRVTYHEENINANTLKLREVLDTMPRFSKDFFRAIEPNTSAKTRISYVYDIRLFFRFLIQLIYFLIHFYFFLISVLLKSFA